MQVNVIGAGGESGQLRAWCESTVKDKQELEFLTQPLQFAGERPIKSGQVIDPLHDGNHD